MKKFLILLITVGICTLFAQNTLKVATYNIQGMKPGTEPVTRIQHITNKFIELDPDIIGLQEINEDKSGDNSDNQAIIIANALSNYFSIPYNYYYQKHMMHGTINLILQHRLVFNLPKQDLHH